MTRRWNGYQYLAKSEKVNVEKKLRKVVFVVLRDEWPELYSGQKNIEDNKSLKNRVLGKIKRKCSATEYNKAVYFMALLIETGNKQGRWHITIPPYHQLVRRERSPFTSYSFQQNQQANTLIDLATRAIISDRPMTRQILATSIILSAVLNGGVHTWERLAGVSRLSPSEIRCEEGLIWLDVSIDPHDRTGRFTHKSPIKHRLWRWYPDSMTAFLLLVWKQQEGSPIYQDIGLPQVSVAYMWKNIKDYLKDLGCIKDDIPRSLYKLFECGSARLSFYAPSFIVQYAYGRNKSTSLEPLASSRVRTGKSGPGFIAVTLEKSNPSSGIQIADQNRHDANSAQEMELLKTVRKLFSKSASGLQRDELAEKIREIISHNKIEPTSVCGGVMWWIISLLEKKTKNRKTIQIKSIYEYLSALAPRLFSYGSGLDMVLVTQDQLLDLYESVLADCPSDNRRQFISSRIKDFHRFMQSTYGVVEIPFNEIDGFIGGEGTVSANVITPQEYAHILDLIRPKNPNTHRLLDISALIVMIAFRLGMRLGEVLRLTLGDIIIADNGEILVRANTYGRLKTRNARRRLPLAILMPAEEREWLMNWYDTRQKETSGDIDSLLFTLVTEENSLIRADKLLPTIHLAMRQVTGDQTVRYHILRHSFANWTLLRFIQSEIPSVLDKSLTVFDADSFTDVACQNTRNYFFSQDQGNDIIPVRSALYQLAQLLGHSSPEVTLKHYVHICDYLLSKCLPGNLNWLDAMTFRRLTNLSESSVYNYLGYLQQGKADMHQFFRKLSAWVNVEPDPLASQMTLPNLQPITPQIIDTESGRQAEIAVESIKILQGAAGEKGISAEKLELLVKQKEADLTQINHWLKAAKQIQSTKVIGVTCKSFASLKLLPTIPHGNDEQDETLEFLSALIDAWSKKEKATVEYGMNKFLSSVSTYRSESRFSNPQEAVRYIDFLHILNIADSRIRILHLPKRGSDAVIQKNHREHWHKNLKLPIESSDRKDQKATRVSGDYGWVGISVDHAGFSNKRLSGAKKYKVKKQAAESFRCALHIFAIFREKNKITTELSAHLNNATTELNPTVSVC